MGGAHLTSPLSVPGKSIHMQTIKLNALFPPGGICRRSGVKKRETTSESEGRKDLKWEKKERLTI